MRTQGTPPRFLEWALLRLLAARDRETISGDLLEEYREEQLPRLGPLGANVWYLRQALSFFTIRIAGGPHMRQALMAMSVFIAAAGMWLAVMENVLRHSGYVERSMVAAAIVVEGLATLLYLLVNGRAVFGALVAAGALGAGLLGIWSIARILSAKHFEGYVLLIGLGLVTQSVLTFLVVLRTRVYGGAR